MKITTECRLAAILWFSAAIALVIVWFNKRDGIEIVGMAICLGFAQIWRYLGKAAREYEEELKNESK